MFASGSTWGDADGDGKLDVFIPTQLGQRDFFFRSLGGGKFGWESLGEATETKGGNFSATWADIDGDGDLDLYVGGPALEIPGPGLVYRNDGGKFVRVTVRRCCSPTSTMTATRTLSSPTATPSGKAR
jgi:hypothetical protein